LPSGLKDVLDGDLKTRGPESALLLERRFSLKPEERRTLYFLYGYLPQGTELGSLVSKYKRSPAGALEDSCRRWKEDGLRFQTEGEPWVGREVTWNHYYLRSNLTYDDFFEEHILSQGSIYQYVAGFQGAARDPLQHALPLVFSDPKILKQILRYTLKEVRSDGSLPYAIVGHGVTMPIWSDYASDLPLWLLWAASEYVLAIRDKAFLDEQVCAYPPYGPTAGKESVGKLLARCYRHLVEDVGTGKHGLMRMLQDDWNDAIVSLYAQKARKECVEQGESVLNSAMATYVFDYYARMLSYAGYDPDLVADARRRSGEHRKAAQTQWTGKWFRRAWLGPTLGWLGEKGLWLEPQPWAIIGGITSAEQAQELIQSVNEMLRRPSPIGAIQMSKNADPIGGGLAEAGELEGGIWFSLNITLVWALALANGEMAWDEWKKNSFARHAEVYPDVWYETWSGPDTINSTLSNRPGKTIETGTWAVTPFPIANMHSHACMLYGISKLLGMEFTETGVNFAPTVPLKEYEFRSPILGFKKSDKGYSGWYAPAQTGRWSMGIRIPVEEAARFSEIHVNEIRQPLSILPPAPVRFTGDSEPGTPLRWEIT
jgi:cellobiose phosphorylase